MICFNEEILQSYFNLLNVWFHTYSGNGRSGRPVCSYNLNPEQDDWFPYLYYHITFLILKLQVFCYILISLQFLYLSVLVNYDGLTVNSTLFAHFRVSTCESRGQPHAFNLGPEPSSEMQASHWTRAHQTGQTAIAAGIFLSLLCHGKIINSLHHNQYCLKLFCLFVQCVEVHKYTCVGQR